MKTINRPETIAMPMLRVECSYHGGHHGINPGNWPEFVQCLPPKNSLMESTKSKRAYVEGYCFLPSGIIQIYLTDDKKA